MKNNYFRRRKTVLAEINVVPYIDVMLVLLVIFMIATPLLQQGIKVKLPHANSKTIDNHIKPIIVSIDQQGHYYLNSPTTPKQPISSQQLKHDVSTQLQQTQQPAPVYVKADRDVNYGQVIQAMVILQHAGASNIGLITQPISHKK